MERHDVLAMMTALKLSGMRAAYDDILADGIKRRHPAPKIIAALLQAEIADKTARSIKYQMASARLPMAKELADFDFSASPVNEALIQELVTGVFLEGKRNLVLVGGTGSGKTHLAVAIVRACIRQGCRGRCYNTVDLVNLLEAEHRAGRQGRIAEQIARRDFVVLDELGYLPLRPGRRAAALPPDEPALRAHLDHHHHKPRLRRMALRVRRSQDDHRAPRPSDPSLRNRRNRQRELALQTSIVTRRCRAGGPVAPVGQQAPPTRLRSTYRRALRGAARGPPVDYRDNLHRGQSSTPIRGQL